MAGDFSLWLASASPRRAALLRQLGVSTRQFAVDVDESVEADEAPECYVRRVTHLKLETALEEIVASGENTLVPVLAADTAVIVDGESLGKPRDRQHALAMLARLSGRRHEVLTHVTVAQAGGRREEQTGSTQVWFRSLAPEEGERYWRSGEPEGKAGAYAIQGLGAAFIERIDGSYSAVMGLPLFETARLLACFGVRVV